MWRGSRAPHNVVELLFRAMEVTSIDDANFDFKFRSQIQVWLRINP